MGVLERLWDNVKAMSGPARQVLDDLNDSLSDILKDEKYSAKDSLDQQFEEMKKLREEVLLKEKSFDKPKVELKKDNEIIKDTLLVAFISLVAKLTKADGVVTPEEIKAFDKLLVNEFKFNVTERKVAAKIFNEAKKNTLGYQDFAKQIAHLSNHEICLTIYSTLFKIASVNYPANQPLEDFLLNVGNILRISQKEYDGLRKQYFSGEVDPFEVLGVPKDISTAELKKHYKKLLIENHPDKLMAKGLPDDFIKEAQSRVAEINKAYDAIMKDRSK